MVRRIITRMDAMYGGDESTEENWTSFKVGDCVYVYTYLHIYIRGNVLSKQCFAAARGVMAAAFRWRSLATEAEHESKESIEKFNLDQLEELQQICGSNTKPAMGNDHSSCRAQGAALQNRIDWLQRLVNERSQQINTLESMLGNVRQQLALSDDKVRQLEAELSKAKLIAANGTKKVEELEQETGRLRRELESEKQLSDQLLSTATLLLGLQVEIRQLSNDAVTREKELQEATEKLQV
ncbi:hypothetical protein HN51_067008 [Arachis hypogaea]